MLSVHNQQSSKFIRKNDLQPVILYAPANSPIRTHAESFDKARKFHYNIHKTLQHEQRIEHQLKSDIELAMNDEKSCMGLGRGAKLKREKSRLGLIGHLQSDKSAHLKEFDPIDWCLKCYTSALSNTLLRREREREPSTTHHATSKFHHSNLQDFIDGFDAKRATSQDDEQPDIKESIPPSQNLNKNRCHNHSTSPRNLNMKEEKNVSFEAESRLKLERDLSFAMNGFYKVPPRTPASPPPLPNPFERSFYEKSPREDASRGRYLNKRARDQVRLFREKHKMKTNKKEK